MKKKKSWILRPVSWLCTLAMYYVMCIVSAFLCSIGRQIVDWLGTLPTLAIILLTMAFGSLFASLVYISARFLPVLIIYLSDKIYPSNHAFRYYFIGIVSSLIYAIVLFSAIRSIIPLGPNFWTYALFVYLIFSSIVMIVHGHIDAEERHRES